MRIVYLGWLMAGLVIGGCSGTEPRGWEMSEFTVCDGRSRR